jgi:hypothetical protein
MTREERQPDACSPTVAAIASGRSRGTRPRASVGAAEPVDRQVAGPEGEAPERQAERDAALPGRRLEGLLHELVRHGADQHTGAEGHDQPEQPAGDRHVQRDQAADDERRAGERAPEKRFSHQPAR